MNTVKLYDSDSMLFKFSATVLFCELNDSVYKVVLNETAFFPEGGGQSSDTGTIGDAFVTDVQIENSVIYHYCDKPLTVGSSYKCQINEEERFDKMQNHSGEHIVSGIINRLYGLQNVGFHLSKNEVTLDFNGILTHEQLNKAEELANEAVHKNVPITACYPTPEELKNIDYRSKLELSENVRIVTVTDYDCCACCAPHVKNSGEIGIIKLLNTEKMRGGTRVFMKCGMRAVKDYEEKYLSVAEISVLTCVKQNEVASGVKRLIEENNTLKYEITQSKRKYLEVLTQNINSPDKSIAILVENTDINSMRFIANSLVERTKTFGIFSENANGCDFVIASKQCDMRLLLSDIKNQYEIKGGGNENMIQGTVFTDFTNIKLFFDKIN